MVDSKYKALGIHVFAGGFTMGVRKVMPVVAQLEVHGLGQETVERQLKVPFIVSGSDAGWPDYSGDDVQLAFGNPRCTGFSCVTAGYGEESHGAWSKPTRDIHEFVRYSLRNKFPFFIWESVQQAMTVGRPLLDYLRDEMLAPAGYRVAHVLMNAASFGNAQHRKRYFFVAYREPYKFNVEPPELPERHATVGDFIMRPDLLAIRPEPFKFSKKGSAGYSPDSYKHFNSNELALIPHMPKGICLNSMCRHMYDVVDQHAPDYATKWDVRDSEMPFSMHCITRLHDQDYCPVLSGSCGRYIHPTLDRGLTVRELSLLMGWPEGVTPLGPNPFFELGKGIVPSCGEWLAKQAQLSLDGHWGDDDFESQYDPKRRRWIGKDTHGQLEKTLDLTRWCPPKPESSELYPWAKYEEAI